jgi:small subunit ribosomal protein S17
MRAGKPSREPAAGGTGRAEMEKQEQEQDRNLRMVRIGRVVSSDMDKTIVVRIDRRIQHPLYKRIVSRSSKLYAHDEANECKVGDVVKVMSTRPLSKLKRWRVAEIIERAK